MRKNKEVLHPYPPTSTVTGAVEDKMRSLHLVSKIRPARCGFQDTAFPFTFCQAKPSTSTLGF
jgi:hypothetical protein